MLTKNSDFVPDLKISRNSCTKTWFCDEQPTDPRVMVFLSFLNICLPELKSKMMIEIMTVFLNIIEENHVTKIYLIACPEYPAIVYLGLNITKLFVCKWKCCVLALWHCIEMRLGSKFSKSFFTYFVERTWFPKANNCCSCSSKKFTSS